MVQIKGGVRSGAVFKEKDPEPENKVIFYLHFILHVYEVGVQSFFFTICSHSCKAQKLKYGNNVEDAQMYPD